MARYIPSKETLKWFEDNLRKDPYLHRVLDKWEHLPCAPQFADPEWYVPYLGREDWGALPAKPGAAPLTNKIMYIRWTWTGKEDCYNIEECSRLLRKLQKEAMDKGLPDIQYNFMVGAKGVIYEGRGWDWEADRDEKYNNREASHGKLQGQTIDIAYIGDMSFYGPMNDVMMGGAHFIHQSAARGRIDDMFEAIPYRDRPTDFATPEAYFDETSVPEPIVQQIREAERQDEIAEKEGKEIHTEEQAQLWDPNFVY